jgi:hypothetical protein
MTLDDAPVRACCIDTSLRSALEQARLALDAAVDAVVVDPEAASDDVVAARLLVNTALLKLDQLHAG